METAIYPGSFDPITNGHLDVLETGAKIFGKVIIAVARNSEKNGFLTVDQRVELIKQSVQHLPNVEVDSFDGLTINYARSKNARVLLRGLRAVSDFEYEMQLSQTNSALCDEVKTVFLITKPEYNFISSSSIREILLNGGDISMFVPESVYKYLSKQYKNI
ncbi:MAG: pantetheine-phosphate adenylyltransferase [Heliobacteriaceae bacterium]|jgi:pantetheine-phosphate adenylyltransferase|nr:pantetheine-phosphate adenylyltransferase [Heliobacteriaceae bacterium]